MDFLPEQDEIITLVDEDGNEHDAIIYSIVEFDGKNYAIVIPVGEEEEEEEEAEAFVLRIDQDDEEGEILVEIDDEEWEKVKDACMEEMIFEEEDQD
ncbi:DUF1292 domain-containing protein [Desulfotruncus arcticus]|uniref:DUF1292 domain-containing protein n=1 Tax=Desulfotruncus arcticus TaxID=341036 RepID=UPI00307EA176